MLLNARVVVWLAASLCAAGATAAFLLARPHNSKADQRTVDFAHVHHYSPASVRAAFAAEGITLSYHATAPRGMLWLSATPLPVDTRGLYVMVGGRTGKVSWGPATGSTYDRSIGNLDVHYGGTDSHILAALEAAVSHLS